MVTTPPSVVDQETDDDMTAQRTNATKSSVADCTMGGKVTDEMVVPYEGGDRNKPELKVRTVVC